MAQHRTKKDKIQAAIRREQATYSFSEIGISNAKQVEKLDSNKATVQTKSVPQQSLLSYSVSYIWKDLLRSAISSTIIIAIVIGLWMYTR